MWSRRLTLIANRGTTLLPKEQRDGRAGSPIGTEEPLLVDGNGPRSSAEDGGSFPVGTESDRRFTPKNQGRTALLGASGMAVGISVWLALILFTWHSHVASVPTAAKVGVAAISTLAEIFGAWVLFLFPPARARGRLHWIAGSLAVLGAGGLGFGYLQPLLDTTPDMSRSVAEWLLVLTIGVLMIGVGLIPRTPPRFSWPVGISVAALFAAASLGIVSWDHSLPLFVHGHAFVTAAARSEAVLPGLTGWFWAWALVTLALSVVAAWGTIRHVRGGTLGGWLLLAMVLLAGSQLHEVIWPTAYSPYLSTSDLLRLAFAIVIATGGIYEQRFIAERRSLKLATEQEHSKRLGELGVLKANFTAMVAHELGSPLAAIRMFTDMLSTRDLSHTEQAPILEAIHKEIDALTTLVRDVQTAATVERDDFKVEPRPVSLGTMLAQAAIFARSLSDNHPLIMPISVNAMVWTDPDRIGQVLRNLLSNACKYTPDGVPIELRATRLGHWMRIEVIDHGPGIHPEDVSRIFEKFGRGRGLSGQKVPGVGLGLYLSRRIIQAHGSDLTVGSRVGGGAVFGFELEVVL